MTSTRHAFTTGGDDMVGAISNRNIILESCIFKTTSSGGGVGAVDFHGVTEWSSISKCEIHGGVSLGGNFIDVIDNQISSQVYLVYLGELSGFDIRIQGNRGRVLTSAPGASTNGLFVDVGGGLDHPMRISAVGQGPLCERVAVLSDLSLHSPEKAIILGIVTFFSG